MNSDKVIRKELLALLKGGEAHMGFDRAVSGFPMKDINTRVPKARTRSGISLNTCAVPSGTSLSL